MDSSDLDLLAINQGAVTAPAGCGKTHVIATTLKRHESRLPILILTHTNAGVAALKSRLDKAEVKQNAYRLVTIDGWAVRLIKMFPQRSGNEASTEGMSPNYDAIRVAAIQLLASGDIADCIHATYSRVIVDEYQDCSEPQHTIVTFLANILPTVVLGDPLQAIFGFKGNKLPHWDNVVCQRFPVAAELSVPWRWNKVGMKDFGLWLLDSRKRLLAGDRVDFNTSPKGNLHWVQLDGNNDYEKQLKAARVKPVSADGSVLIIGNAKNPPSQQELASRTGAVTVENVDLKDFTAFAQSLDFESPMALATVIKFASKVMTAVSPAAYMKRIETLQAKREQREATDAEMAGLKFLSEPTPPTAAFLLSELSRQGGTHVYRMTVLRSCLKALNACDKTSGNSFAEVAIKVREQSRILGRPLPKRAVGSTLLLKGLEADTAVIIDPAFFDHIGHTYVAMTRGSHRLVVCSPRDYF